VLQSPRVAYPSTGSLSRLNRIGTRVTSSKGPVLTVGPLKDPPGRYATMPFAVMAIAMDSGIGVRGRANGWPARNAASVQPASPVRVSAGCEVASITVWSAGAETWMRRGLAFSATGMLRVSTPLW
jgi:hypothetical protein